MTTRQEKRGSVLKRYEHGGNIYEAAPLGGWLDFSANINPLGLAPGVKEAVRSSIDGVVHYPDPAARELREAIASYYGINAEAVIPGNGAAELIYLFFQVIRPRCVLIPVPSFSDYERAALASGAEILPFPLPAERDFAVDWERLTPHLTQVDAVVLGNPNNPTGTVLSRAGLTSFLQAAERCGVYVMVDESFLDFLPDGGDSVSLKRLTSTYPHLFVVTSMTKFFAIPGLRLGFGVAGEPLRHRLNAAKDVWNVSLPAQKAGVAAVKERSYQEESRVVVSRERAYLTEAIRHWRGIRVIPGCVNFLLLDVKGTGRTGSDITAAFRGRGILVRDCSNYPGLTPYFIRIAVRSHEENSKFIEIGDQIL